MTYAFYTVKAGDSLSKIAEKFKTSVKDIQKLNSKLIKNPNDIKVGWTLRIPVSEPSENRYETIGRAFTKCSEDLEKLDSFQELMELLEMEKV